MNRYILLVLMCITHLSTYAQKKSKAVVENDIPVATSTTERLHWFDAKKKMADTSWFKNVPLRNIGPSIMSGRVTDIAVSPSDPTRFYVAYASGGLWRSTNNGQSFTPLFDHEAAITIGAIAVDWAHGETIWVGTGEVNSSRSSYAGVGIYKSIDTGKTWQYMGLPETHHIGKIVIDPSDPNTVLVAALGHLYTANTERGIFKTIDGGKTWKKTLYIDDNTGGVDLAMEHANTKVVYASVWHRERRAWNFTESGNTSGIYLSKDGGDTWQLITKKESGFPTGEGVGRIGIGLSANASNLGTIYALIDNNEHRPKDTAKKKEGLTKEDFRTMPVDSFIKLDNKKLGSYLTDNGFPKKYTAEVVKQMVKDGKAKPNDLATYIEDANSKLFDTPVKGAELYYSNDWGNHWQKTHKEYLPAMFNGYGYYFARVVVDPNDDKVVYVVGFYTLKSTDGGKTFSNILKDNVHVDCHSLWLDPNRKGHIMLGTDGGLHISYDDGAHWVRCNTPAVGQFYSVNVDNASPYNVYGGLQDNGVWYGPSTNNNGDGWQMDGAYPFKSILGGDGMQVAVDTINKVAYTGYQFGNYYKVDLNNPDDARYITPKHNLGERPLRWNWQSPVMLSKFNPGIVYFGSNKLFRSTNGARSFDFNSTDLTDGGKAGNVPYGTITTIDESPVSFGLIYAGTDDGLVWMSRDNGNTFTKISDKLPQHYWISRVLADLFDEHTIYVSLNGYRMDNFSSLIFVSHDNGATWSRIGLNLPAEPVNVIKQDANNRNILYVGTDNGLDVSLNNGANFMPMCDMPSVAVHDLVVNKKEKEVAIGTHGRSIYIARVKELEQLVDSVIKKQIYVFNISGARFNKGWGKRNNPWEKYGSGEITIPVWVNTPGKSSLEIKFGKSLSIYKHDTVLTKGLHYLTYNLTIDSTLKSTYETALNKASKDSTVKISVKVAEDHKLYLQPGKYTLIASNGNNKASTQTFEITAPRNENRDEDLPGADPKEHN